MRVFELAAQYPVRAFAVLVAAGTVLSGLCAAAVIWLLGDDSEDA